MSGAQEVARRPDRTPLSQRDPIAIAKHFFQSGYFADTKSMSQAVVKIIAGEELGLGPMTSMQGIHIIKGKPTMSANLHGVQVKRSGKYNFRPLEITGSLAKIEWFEDGESVGFTEFTIEQAKTAGLIKADSGWTRYPEDMLFARALTRGIRRFCPEVTAGSPAYTPEELGAEIDEQGDPIYVDADIEEIDGSAGERLDDDRLDRLVQGYEIAGPLLGGLSKLDGLNILLGSLGYDGYDLDGFDLRTVAGKWSPDQADAVLAGFERAVDEDAVQDAEEVDAVVVPDGEEAANAGA